MSATVKKSTVEKYSIRAGHEYATICLSQWGPAQQGLREGYYGGEILINSSFGSFNHAWTSCGEPFKKFLIGIDMDYFMKKCLGTSYRVYDGEATFKGVVQHVLEYRRDGSYGKVQAREIYDDLIESQSEIESSEEAFGRSTDGWLDEYYDFIQYMPAPQAVGFWKTIWPVFEAELKSETAQREMVTDEGQK